MNGFWLGISLIIAIYLAILFISEPLAQMMGVAVIPVSLLCLIIGLIIGSYAILRNLDIIKIILIYWKDLIFRRK